MQDCDSGSKSSVADKFFSSQSAVRHQTCADQFFPNHPCRHTWGNIDQHKFDDGQLTAMKKTCQQHCFSTLNHNLAYCYNDAWVIKFVWTNLVKNRLKGGARSFED